MSQKKTQAANEEVTGRNGDDGIRIRETQYQVDSELGRFTFCTHEVVEEEKVVFKSTELFPPQRGKELYLTQGFRELAMLMGATESSYRKTIERFNRQRWQQEGGTPVTTLRDETEAEGKQVLELWESKTEAVLEQFGVDQEPLRPELSENVEKVKEQSLMSPAEVEQAMERVEIPEEVVEEVLANPVAYEHSEKSVNISVDGVVTKAQREKRRRAGTVEPSVQSENNAGSKERKQKSSGQNSGDSHGKKNKRLNHKTATIEHDGNRYTLVAATYVALFRTILAFVLNNGLHRLRLCFFTDGELSLKNALVAAFSWHPAVAAILDWHHIGKKCAELLSMAVKGRNLRNEHLDQVTRLLWYGATQSAIEYLKQIPAHQIKSAENIERLCAYLDKRRTMIPCYAIRKELGLRNSSNPVEKANDHLVSSRQKHQGMSWSKEGSLALAALSAVVKNRHRESWLQGRVIPFTLVPSNDETVQKVLDKVA